MATGGTEWLLKATDRPAGCSNSKQQQDMHFIVEDAIKFCQSILQTREHKYNTSIEMDKGVNKKKSEEKSRGREYLVLIDTSKKKKKKTCICIYYVLRHDASQSSKLILKFN